VGLINQTGPLTLGLANVLAIPANGTLRWNKTRENKSTIWSHNTLVATMSKTRNFCGKMMLCPSTYLEESGASIASKDAVMFARGMILAHSARNIVQDPA
jgi:hypothetical protein